MPVPRSPGSNVPFRLSLRCGLNQAEVKAAPHKMLLHDAVLVSYYPRQVKIAELPLDSFRMLQVGLLGGARFAASVPAWQPTLALFLHAKAAVSVSFVSQRQVQVLFLRL